MTWSSSHLRRGLVNSRSGESPGRTVSRTLEAVKSDTRVRSSGPIQTSPARPSSRIFSIYSFGSFITVCRIQRNDAERRVEAVLRGEPDPGPSGADVVSPDVVNGDAEGALTRLDLMQAAEDEITACIRARFPDHDLARLVETILQAEGFYTRRSTPGPDGGADVLCGSGPLGLDQPFLCVQVKATQGTTDVKVFRELAGTMAAFKATQGLLASWGGFTQGVVREARQETFKIRLWDQSDLVKAVYRTYDRLDAQIQAELPLKRIWMLVHEDEEGDE